jgi:hypothetical protein
MSDQGNETRGEGALPSLVPPRLDTTIIPASFILNYERLARERKEAATTALRISIL